MTTSAYGASEIAKLLPRRHGELYTLLHAMVPVAFPEANAGAMELSLIGFTSTVTGWTENTATARNHAPFSEIGIFNVPAGPWDHPAPDPDPHAPNNAWGALASDGLVKHLNGGHPAPMAPDAWKTDHRAQVAVGIADQLGYDRGIRAGLPSALKPSSTSWSPYRVGLMFAGFTMGPAGVAHALHGYDAGTVPPEAQRWPWLRAEVVRRQDSTAARAVFSGEAKLESARVVAERVHEAPDNAFLSWWESSRPRDTAEATALAHLAAIHRGTHVAGGPVAASPGSFGGVVVLLGIAGLVYLLR